MSTVKKGRSSIGSRQEKKRSHPSPGGPDGTGLDCTATNESELTPFASYFFFLEYAKDLRIIAIKKKKVFSTNDAHLAH
jgi:hypothetical protein